MHLGRLAALVAAGGLVVGFGSAPPQTHASTHGAEAAWCSGAVSWQAARSQLGEVVRVKARVAGVVYASKSAGKPTFIDLGADYPSPRRLTVVIWGRHRRNFPAPPERMFSPGKLICAQGVVTSFRGVAQIEVALWDSDGRLLSF